MVLDSAALAHGAAANGVGVLQTGIRACVAIAFHATTVGSHRDHPEGDDRLIRARFLFQVCESFDARISPRG